MGGGSTAPFSITARALWIDAAAEDIVGGMSDSPIIKNEGGAIGVLCISGGTGEQGHREGGPNPRLAAPSTGLAFARTGDPYGKAACQGVCRRAD
jgi:hypothetical protein